MRDDFNRISDFDRIRAHFDRIRAHFDRIRAHFDRDQDAIYNRNHNASSKYARCDVLIAHCV